MIDIARCESGFTQFNPDGSVFRGKVNHKDVGYFQINERWNGADAKARGFDIYTEKGNVAYALYLYHSRGTQPWLASKDCWGGSNAPPSQGLVAANL